MKQIDQDILELKEGIIFHQVNCMGVMGSGIALAIRQKWPHVFAEYRKFWEEATRNGAEKWRILGSYQVVKVDENLFAVNVFGQYDFGANQGRKTEYSALHSSLEFFNTFERSSDQLKKLNLYVPYKMSSDRAGGDWEIVKDIINFTLGDEVIICKKPE